MDSQRAKGNSSATACESPHDAPISQNRSVLDHCTENEKTLAEAVIQIRDQLQILSPNTNVSVQDETHRTDPDRLGERLEERFD